MSESKDFIENIAVIGLAGRFPGAENIDQFWHNLREGIESIHRFTAQELESMGVPPEVFNQPDYVKAGTLLKNADMFDADFFGFNPKEASLTDPQHRIFLECAWKAIENAGYNVESRVGPIGVFAGASPNYYSNMIPFDYDATLVAEAYQREIGNEKAYLCTLVSYKLNLKGPSLTIQTACSTSLVAVCLACQSLLNYQCDMALAGGVCVNTRQRAGYFYQEGLIPSPDGHCRAFDARAQGTVLGQGAGIVVLKRLSDAIADGDTICAVIKGSAINNDGSVKVGYTAPSVNGQAEVIAMAQALSGISPENISYIETHGTGTQLGDTIEIAALSQVFRETTNKKGFCAIGSVKSNIGHLDAAAGVTSLIKTILMLKHKEIPPTLHFEKPNPNIDFENSPFHVNAELKEWKSVGNPRQTGVSSFGLGGTNAHVVLEEAPVINSSEKSRPWQLLLLSAKTNTALDALTSNLCNHLKQHPDINIADVSYTLQIGRKSFDHRRMLVCQDLQDAVTILATKDSKRIATSFQEPVNRNIVFMFSGQASEYVNMGLELYTTEKIFQKEIDHCSEILNTILSLDLRDILYPDDKDIEDAKQKIKHQSITQTALFVIEYALAKLWMSWGINPIALVGHSIGEYTAGCLAGTFSLENALSIVAARGKLMDELPPGSMLAVFLSEKNIRPYLNQKLSVALINGPSLCVISGETEAIKDLEKSLSDNNVDFRLLHTNHAFHSKMTEQILDTFTDHMKKVTLNPPRIPFVSNVTGTWITPEEATDPNYWVRHLRNTIRFSDCIEELLKEPNRVFLEVGPGKTLSTLVRQHPDKTQNHIVLSSTRHPNEQKSDVAHIFNTIGHLWLAGIQVDWPKFYTNERRIRIPLPTYPFDRKRYWLKEKKQIYPVSSAPLHYEESEKSISVRQVSSEPKTDLTNVADPTNDTEQFLANIWKDLLGYDQISVHDNFFDLGGSSLLALALFAQIDKRFGKKLPLATLYEAPTIEQLTNILCEEEWTASWSSLVEIQPVGSKPPLFLIHGAGGNVLIYRDLVRYLGNDQPVYGLQSQGLDGKQPILTTIEDMASQYLKEIRAVQPKGPYLLGGYCMGGTVALEIAQQLHGFGEEVAFLALLETYNFSKISNLSLFERTFYYMQKIEFHWRNYLLLGTEDKAIFIKEKVKVAKSRKKVWLGMIRSIIDKKTEQGNEDATSLFNLWEANDIAALSYVPKVYPGHITQFRPIKEYALHCGPELGWDNLAAGGLEVHQLPAYPAGMLVEPFVGMLAEKLKSCIMKI